MEILRVNWKQVLATAVITGVIAIITGMILFYFQKREPKLTYFLSDTIPFQGDKETLAIYNIIIRNDGSKIVEDVDCQISVSPARIKDYRVTGVAVINYKETPSTNAYKVHFSDLNPDESITITILTSYDQKTLSRPEVTLRGKGISGTALKQGESIEKSFLNSPMFAAFISGYSVLVALMFYRKRRMFPFRSMGRFLDSERHSDDQNEIIAYLFNIHGFPDIAESYLKRHRTPSYWSEADYIAAGAIKDADMDTKEKKKQILIDLLTYADIAPSSEGIIHYNIARIAKNQGKQAECEEHLKKSQEIIPRLLKKRLSLDPIFKDSPQGKDKSTG